VHKIKLSPETLEVETFEAVTLVSADSNTVQGTCVTTGGPYLCDVDCGSASECNHC
jgi:hypothetical protein